MTICDDLPSPRERHPGLDELDYWSINSPEIGVLFYNIVGQLPEEMKVKLMEKESKVKFCLNIHYVYDTEHDWEKEYILKKLEEIITTANFNTEESEMFIQAVEKTCHMKFTPYKWLKAITDRFKESLERL